MKKKLKIRQYLAKIIMNRSLQFYFPGSPCVSWISGLVTGINVTLELLIVLKRPILLNLCYVDMGINLLNCKTFPFLILARYVPNVAKRSIWDQCNIEDLLTDRLTTDLCSWKSLPGRTSNGHISITVDAWSPVSPSNKLYSVQPAVGRSVSSSLGRYDSVLINRLRIGHTRLKNFYLLKGENQPVCEACHSPLTVKHILVYCTRYSAARQRYFGVDTLEDVFENVASHKIIAYVKDINFYNRI